MPTEWRMKVRGIERAQAAMIKAINAVKTSGGLGRAFQFAVLAGIQWARRFTHRITGSLSASHVPEFSEQPRGLLGRIYIDPGVVNPLTGQRPAEYGPYEHFRGAEHAFYKRVIDEKGVYIASRAVQMIVSQMPGDTR